jgi:hypothetical protein
LVVEFVAGEEDSGGGAEAASSGVVLYMRRKVSRIWEREARVKETWWSMRPGRMRAASRVSGVLVVIMRTWP